LLKRRNKQRSHAPQRRATQNHELRERRQHTRLSLAAISAALLFISESKFSFCTCSTRQRRKRRTALAASSTTWMMA
jgi:hypothetical protein